MLTTIKNPNIVLLTAQQIAAAQRYMVAAMCDIEDGVEAILVAADKPCTYVTEPGDHPGWDSIAPQSVKAIEAGIFECPICADPKLVSGQCEGDYDEGFICGDCYNRRRANGAPKPAYIFTGGVRLTDIHS